MLFLNLKISNIHCNPFKVETDLTRQVFQINMNNILEKIKCHFNLFSTFHRYFTSFEYNSLPVLVINTDYAFIRLVDKSNGKDWC